MTRFNEAQKTPHVQNLAGGTAYPQDARNELAGIVLTSFLGDKFYRTGKDELDRLAALTHADPLFAAKAAVYGRNEFGMRSVSHVIAGEVTEAVKGEQWVKHFIDAVVRRPDDMTEIVAYRASRYGLHPMPNALKKGLARAFDKFDGYQLAKYRGGDKAVSLIDVVNLVKPRPVEQNAEALAQLVAGTLRQTETWESQMSSGADKAETWNGLLQSGKLGYMALLRNLRNIAQTTDDETFTLALTQLADADRVRKSLILPFRYVVAMTELEKSDIPETRRAPLNGALSVAVEHAVMNIPDMPGRTLISVDSSGSMTSGTISQSDVRLGVIAALFAAALAKRLTGRSSIILFDTEAYGVSINPADSVMSITNALVQRMRGGGTNLDLAFASREPYDRVIILSDMQAWLNGQWAMGSSWRPTSMWTPRGVEHRPANDALNEYRKRTGADPSVYAFDLAGHGSLQFPASRCYQIAGWSEKVFDLIPKLDEDRSALISTINETSFV